jgi:hypothetical protein
VFNALYSRVRRGQRGGQPPPAARRPVAQALYTVSKDL